MPRTPAPAPALVRRVGEFVLLDRLGAGGMGVVYAAFDERLERKVAIKLVAAQGDEIAQQRLLREAQAQARLSHPNVVTIYEVDTLPDGGLFIAMELVKGATLRAWVTDAAPTWRELVPIFAAAGEGLAAAHRSGIVHRDFKPDNVLIGDDGRVRVADFGLAFTAQPAAGEAASPVNASDAGPSPALARRPPLAAPLTAAGSVIGTPGYMAPEQFTEAVADARSDQFSFCVALYEAMHGERPYADFAFIGPEPERRRLEPEPAYPRWLWDVVTRGLSLEPAARFASMDELVAELTRNRQRRRRRVIAGLAVVGGLLAATGGAALMVDGPEPCPLATDELTGVWDPMLRHRTGAALLATGLPSAAPIWTSTALAFDRQAQRWLVAQHAACEATYVRHTQSDDLLDRRMACLAERKRTLGAAAEVLREHPVQAVAHVGDLVSSLGEIDLCADTSVLLEQGARPVGHTFAAARDRAMTNEIRGRLARSGALLATGDVATAAPEIAEAATLARGQGDAVEAEVRYFEGWAALTRARVPDAVALFDRAVALAVASRHDELVVDVWLTLAGRAGRLEQRPAEIERWLGEAETWLRRLGHPNDPRQIEAEHARGSLQLIAGDVKQARETLSRAIATGEQLWGGNDPRLIQLLRDRALALAQLAQAKPAVADGERALALGIAAWGEDHPDIARSRAALGLLYIEQLGDLARGEHEIMRARAIYLAQLGPDAIEVATCEQALSEVGQYRGDYTGALDHAERAEQIFAQTLGPAHPRHGEALMGLGVLRFMHKDFTASLAAYDAAYPILRDAVGEHHATIGLLLSNTGETLLALGRDELAQVDFARALDNLEANLGPEHVDLALPLKGLGLAHLHRGRPRDALAPLERALALTTGSGKPGDPQELAEIRWGLARALRGVGKDPTRTYELARQALAAYRELGPESADRVNEISKWLSQVTARSERL